MVNRTERSGLIDSGAGCDGPAVAAWSAGDANELDATVGASEADRAWPVDADAACATGFAHRPSAPRHPASVAEPPTGRNASACADASSRPAVDAGAFDGCFRMPLTGRGRCGTGLTGRSATSSDVSRAGGADSGRAASAPAPIGASRAGAPVDARAGSGAAGSAAGDAAELVESADAALAAVAGASESAMSAHERTRDQFESTRAPRS